MDMRRFINIIEGDISDITHDEELAAIGQFLANRAIDNEVEPRISTKSFIHLANKIGLSLTPETLMDMIESDKLTGIIKDANQDEIVFHGKEEVKANSDMTVDKAKNIVKKMAKRQAKKKKK